MAATQTSNDKATGELTVEQQRNLRKLLRGMAKGHNPGRDLPDIGPQLSKIFPDLIEAFEDNGIAGFRDACEALRVDYPIIPKLLENSPFKLISINELLSLPDQDWLIESVLYEDAISVIYGLPGCNKSFLAIDWACSLALGWDWKSRTAKQCRIIYVAAEGARGYRRRILAWCKYHNVDAIKLLNNILFLPREVDLFNAAEVAAFIDELALTVEELEEETRQKLPVMVVLDTIFQCSAGQNLNATEVMTQLTAEMKRIKRETNAIHVLAVHHSGKDTSRGMTGNIALKANIDLAYYIEAIGNEGLTKVVTDKAKDDEPIELYLLRHQVIYGDGPRDNSCVMISAEKPSGSDQESEKMQNSLSVLPSDKAIGLMEWLRAINDFFPGKERDKNGNPRPYVSKASLIRYAQKAVDLNIIEKGGTEARPTYKSRLKDN